MRPFYGAEFLVRFEADADQSSHGPLAKLFSAGQILMFSPGLPQFWQEPSPQELDLWEALDSPTPVSILLDQGHSLETLESLLAHGAIEYAD